MKKVKHINFEATLKGNGIVNYDSGDQKYLWNRESKAGNKNVFTSADNNNNYAKKVYFKNEDGDLDYKIKISSDALRNAIFKGDAIATNPSIQHHKTLLNSFIGSPLGLIRGYMFADNETLKRKSPLTITSAIQSNDAVSYMEFHSRSGQKKANNDSDSKDTTLFNKEDIGNITYFSEGFIDVQELQFLSADPIFDRCNFNADDYELLKTFLSGNLPNFNSELGYYTLKTSAIDVSEYGIRLNNNNIVYLIKETLKRILSILIGKANAYAKIDSLKIQLLDNPIDARNTAWVELNSYEDIDNLSFEIEESYVLKDESEAKKQREDIENFIKLATKAKEERKKSKKEGK